MKILNRLKTDAKIIIRDLHNANDSLIDTVVEYQQIIFDQKETIMCQVEEIERLQPYEQLYKDLKDEHLETIKAIKQAESEAVKEFWTKVKEEKITHRNLGEIIYVEIGDEVLKEMVGDSE